MKLKAILTLAVLCGFLTYSFSQNNFWKDANPSDWADTRSASWPVPARYRLLELGFNQLVNAFRAAPIRSGHGRGEIFQLPLPDGSFQSFLLFESPLLTPALAGKFPQIKTYSGMGLDDPAAIAYLDVTEKGFHGMILSPGKSVFIDPFFKNNTEVYACYHKSDSYRAAEHEFSCGTSDEGPILPSAQMSDFDQLRSAAVSLRTYRLAISATGEFTAFHGGTVADAMAAIATTINRVRGIYETELAISFELIADNEDIVYTNASTDPYTSPANTSVNISEVQTTITNVIGSANFDIGHLFAVGKGGVATVGGVCNNSSKARGVTAGDPSLGDPFNVDYVTHEMAHQFGAHHTFNGSTGNCLSNRTAHSAYEPGSGSTILGYAGLCSTQNLQYNTYAHFHRRSLEVIRNFVVDGGGSGCPTVTATSNNTPEVDADPQGLDAIYIPASTPFELTASGTDPDGHAITYNWEQYDLGAQGAPASNLTTGPVFKSLPPSSSPTRSFPILSSILDGTNGNIGEFLPSVPRSLNFICTVRDRQTTGGGFAYDNLVVNVTNSASAFAIASHNTGATVQGNISLNWNVGNTTSSPVNCANVDIFLSLDGGKTFSSLLANTPNDGAQTITLPNTATALARLKVKCSDNLFFDINNADLRIAPADAACEEEVENGSFEDGYDDWDQYSSNGFDLLILDDNAHHGDISALLGAAPDETSSMSQDIDIPADAHFAHLSFWYRLENFDCGVDAFHVKANGSIIHSIDLCGEEAITWWKRETIDLMAYKGTTPTITIELVTNETNDTWLYLDDISLHVCEGGAFPLLPVELVDFQAIAFANDALLTWHTVQESNNAGFEVEMKTDRGDFEKIGFVKGAGNTTQPNIYQFVKKGLAAGTYYFRLRQMDTDGHFQFSTIEQIHIGGDFQLRVFPNPANELVFFEITQATEQVVQLQITDGLGRKVGGFDQVDFGKGTFKLPFRTAGLAPGLYFFRLSANNLEETGRFVVEK